MWIQPLLIPPLYLMYNNGHIPHFIHTNTQTWRAKRVIIFYYLQKQTCYKMQNTCICNFCLHMHSPDAGCHNIYIYTYIFFSLRSMGWGHKQKKYIQWLWVSNNSAASLIYVTRKSAVKFHKNWSKVPVIGSVRHVVWRSSTITSVKWQMVLDILPLNKMFVKHPANHLKMKSTNQLLQDITPYSSQKEYASLVSNMWV